MQSDDDGHAIIDWTRSVTGWSIVLAFDKDCAWSTEVAPRWKDWMCETRTTDVFLITSDEWAEARRYVSSNGWIGNLISLERTDASDQISGLVSRTPWFYVIDHEGIIRAQGHGNEVVLADLYIRSRVAPPDA
jgi:hypothetical protein